MRIVLVMTMLLVMTVAGCGGGPSPVEVEATSTPASQTAKNVLQGVADTGELGSGLEELRMALDEMKSTDSAKADALLSDLQKLEQSGGGEAAKAQAKQMLGKL